MSHVGLISAVDKGVGAKMFYALFAILLVIISLLCILPPVWVLLSGFKEGKEFFSIPPTIIPKHFNFKKLADTWHIFKFGGYYRNTIVLGNRVDCVQGNACRNGRVCYRACAP